MEAKAALGGSTGPEGSAGEGVAAASPGGGVYRVKSFSKGALVAPAVEEEVVAQAPAKKTTIERTVIPNYVEKRVQVPSYVEKTVRVPTYVEKTICVPASPTVVEKKIGEE